MTWLKPLQALCALTWALGAAASAATLTVGARNGPPTVAAALQRAADGDTIEVPSGQYRGDVAVILQRQLTIRGVGATRPVMLADGRHAEGKAIWVVRDGDITIENIEFRGARVPDLNGAGVRFERGRLTVLRCAFFDNEMGLLTSNVESASLQVIDSEFGQAPTHPGSLHHLLYIGRIAHASIRNSRFHDGHIGHLIKSRARETEVIGNTIVDGAQGRASYEIDLPNGGLAQVRGNTIGQSAGTDNPVIVSFGAEGAPWPVSGLTVEDNLITNDRPQGGTFVRVWRERLPADTPVAVRRNRLVGPGQLELGAGAAVEGNVEVARP
jgi:hypothetical protein